MATAWSDINFLVNIEGYEPVLATGLEINNETLKRHLETDLHNKFEHLQSLCENYYDDSSFEVLDHIKNPDELHRPAVYLALYLAFSQQSMGNENDVYTQKSKYYLHEYKKSLDYACRRLRWDTKITDITQNQGSYELLW